MDERIAILGAHPEHFDHDLAALGELQRVPAQVHENLAQAVRIPQHALRNRRIDVDDELDAL